jgi:hypothetical protein
MRHLLVAVGLLASNAAFALACPTADYNLGSSTGAGLLLGTTCGMGNEDTKTCAGTDGDDVSFVWTAPMSGTVGFSLDGSSYDTALQAKEFGTCADTFCNDDFFGLDSYLELTVTAGQTYYLSIDGFNGACGDYVLGVDYVAPPFSLQAGTGGGMVMLQATNAPANTRVYFLASAQTGTTCHPSAPTSARRACSAPRCRTPRARRTSRCLRPRLFPRSPTSRPHGSTSAPAWAAPPGSPRSPEHLALRAVPGRLEPDRGALSAVQRARCPRAASCSRCAEAGRGVRFGDASAKAGMVRWGVERRTAVTSSRPSRGRPLARGASTSARERGQR